MPKNNLKQIQLTEADLTPAELEDYHMGLATLADIAARRIKESGAAEDDQMDYEERTESEFDEASMLDEDFRSEERKNKRLASKVLQGRKETVLYMNMMSPEDREFLRHLYKLGCMSFNQLWHYHFPKKSDSYTRRVLREWLAYGVLEYIVIQDSAAPVVEGRWRRYNGIKVYFLSSEALNTVGAWMGLEDNEIYRKRDNGTRLAHHTLGVNSLILGLHFEGVKSEDGGLILDDWISQREAIISWSTVGDDKQLVKPDGRIDRYNSNSYLFFEYETGEVPPSKVVTKLKNYIQMLSQNIDRFSRGGKYGKFYVLMAFSPAAAAKATRVKTMLKGEIGSIKDAGPGVYQYTHYFDRTRAFEVVFKIGMPKEVITFAKGLLK